MKLEVKKTYNDWLVLLEDLKSGKLTLTRDQKSELISLSLGWPTCACGQLCQNLPKYGGSDQTYASAPADELLRNNGALFHSMVVREDWAGALDVFEKIELRSTYLLNAQTIKAEYEANVAKLR